MRIAVARSDCVAGSGVPADGRSDAGTRVAAGAYMYLIDIGDAMEMKTMVVLK